MVSIETAGQHYRDNDKRAKSGLRASRSVPYCCWSHLCLVYVREMKELFRLILREPPVSGLLLVEGEINENIFTPSFQLRSGAKR